MNFSENESQRAEIEAALRQHRQFEECLIVGVSFSEFRTQLDIDVDYTWDDAGLVRKDVDKQPLLYRLTFYPVFEFHLQNGLTAEQVTHMDHATWSWNEISKIAVQTDDATRRKYAHLNVPIHKISILWTWNKVEAPTDKRIDIVCSSLRVSRP
ncbi:MAG: hypothetical protein WBW04_18030 [Nitrolancea sp.]